MYRNCVFVEMDRLEFKESDHFKYLGTIVNAKNKKNDITKEVAARIQTGNNGFLWTAETVVYVRSPSREIKKIDTTCDIIVRKPGR